MKPWMRSDSISVFPRLALVIVVAFVSACAGVLKPQQDTSFDFTGIRTIYVEPAIVSAVPNTNELRSEISEQFTKTLREQLHANGRFVLVESAETADAVLRADVSEWWEGEWYMSFGPVHGPRAYSRVAATLSLRANNHEVWTIRDKEEQALGANLLFGAFAKHPSSLVNDLVSRLLATLPTYTRQK